MVCVCACVCVCVCVRVGPSQVDELPAELIEFHEVVSQMQEVEEAVVDGHREFYNVSDTGAVRHYLCMIARL